MDKILVAIGSVGLIGFIYWFFLRKKDEVGEMTTNVKIKVAGGYSPALVKVPAGKEITITLTRTDPTDCLEEFVLPDLKIKRSLEINKDEVLKLKFVKPGRYEFHCGMSMYKGAVVSI